MREDISSRKSIFYHLFSVLFGINQKEFWLVQLFLLYYICVASCYTISSTTAITLFLGKLGNVKVENLLPWLYIGNSIAIAVISRIYQTYIDSFSRIKLILYSFIFFICSFLLLRLLISWYSGSALIYFLLSIWEEASGIVMTMIYFSYLGDYFHINNARRLYAYIIGGSALGEPIGGFGASFLLNYIITPNLLYVCILLMCLACGFAYLICKTQPLPTVQPYPLQMDSTDKKRIQLKELFNNKYILFLLFISGLAVFCSCIDSFLFFLSTSQTLDEKSIGHFLGKFYGFRGIALILINYIFVKFSLKQFDILINLIILPILLIILSGSFIFYPVLLMAASIRFVDGTFYQTLHTSAIQILYLPLSNRIRIYTQAISVGIITSGARLFAGITLIVLSFFHVSIICYAILIFSASVTWILLTIFGLLPYYDKMKIIYGDSKHAH